MIPECYTPIDLDDKNLWCNSQGNDASSVVDYIVRSIIFSLKPLTLNPTCGREANGLPYHNPETIG